jgi:hypothetical protein
VGQLEGWDTAWLGSLPEAQGRLLRTRLSKYLKPYGPSDAISLYAAAIIAGEGVVRVGDVVSFRAEEGTRPFVGVVEMLFDSEGCPPGDEGWIPGSKVEAVWNGAVYDEDGELIVTPSWYEGTVVRKWQEGTYHVKFDDGDEDKRCKHENIRRLGRNSKNLVARWLYRHEETKLLESAKDRLLGCKGEVMSKPLETPEWALYSFAFASNHHSDVGWFEKPFERRHRI